MPRHYRPRGVQAGGVGRETVFNSATGALNAGSRCRHATRLQEAAAIEEKKSGLNTGKRGSPCREMKTGWTRPGLLPPRLFGDTSKKPQCTACSALFNANEIHTVNAFDEDNGR